MLFIKQQTDYEAAFRQGDKTKAFKINVIRHYADDDDEDIHAQQVPQSKPPSSKQNCKNGQKLQKKRRSTEAELEFQAVVTGFKGKNRRGPYYDENKRLVYTVPRPDAVEALKCLLDACEDAVQWRDIGEVYKQKLPLKFDQTYELPHACFHRDAFPKSTRWNRWTGKR